MDGLCQTKEVDDAITKYLLSDRAARNSLHDLPWDTLEKMLANLWKPDNPDGLVFLGVAENSLLHQELASYIKSKFTMDPNHLSYGVGPRGLPRLKKALASFFNVDLGAHEHVLEKEVLVLPGVAAVLDAIIWSVCNDGDGVMTPAPFYTGFRPAIGERARGVIVPAFFHPIDGYRGLDDIFDPEMNMKALSHALAKAKQDGVKVRAVLLSNPHNPLGRCYPADTLKEIARFCGRENLHLIVDEVFAKSVYETPHTAGIESFTSILALPLDNYINRQLIHVAYGMGKDFGATGLRLGALQSRNDGLIAAVSSICVFGWVPYVVQEIWATVLGDEAFLTSFRTRNCNVLAEHCQILTTFLDEHSIPYYQKVNAGVFVWVDLWHYVSGEPRQHEATGFSAPSQSHTIMSQESEMRLFRRCLDFGVGISLGSTFCAEELGWFRISFAVDKQALQVGLQRLLKCLQWAKDEAWTSA